ncbi:hypothetical protein CQA26_04750 [Providencia rettgeri]|nr:hypothetical protein CQA26_04750 [Providencia rettgeri]
MTHTKSINFTIILFLSLLASYIASTRITFETSSDDLIRYYSAYSSIPFYTFYEYLTWDNREPLFQLYNLFTYKIFGEIPPNDYLFLMVLPGFIIYAVALKKISVNFQFSSLFFLSLFLPPILMYNTQLIRQGLSFYFLFASFLVSKKSSRNILIFISAGLHFLAVVMIIIYFILHQYITKKTLLSEQFQLQELFLF